MLYMISHLRNLLHVNIHNLQCISSSCLFSTLLHVLCLQCIGCQCTPLSLHALHSYPWYVPCARANTCHESSLWTEHLQYLFLLCGVFPVCSSLPSSSLFFLTISPPYYSIGCTPSVIPSSQSAAQSGRKLHWAWRLVWSLADIRMAHLCWRWREERQLCLHPSDITILQDRCARGGTWEGEKVEGVLEVERGGGGREMEPHTVQLGGRGLRWAYTKHRSDRWLVREKRDFFFQELNYWIQAPNIIQGQRGSLCRRSTCPSTVFLRKSREMHNCISTYMTWYKGSRKRDILGAEGVKVGKALWVYRGKFSCSRAVGENSKWTLWKSVHLAQKQLYSHVWRGTAVAEISAMCELTLRGTLGRCSTVQKFYSRVGKKCSQKWC